MDGNLLRVHDLLAADGDFLHIAVLVLALHNHVAVVARELVLVQVGALPHLGSDDLLGLVVDVVHGGLDGLPVLEVEGPEHASVPEVVLVQVQVLVLSEVELGFSHCVQLDIPDVIVVNRLVLWLSSVGNTHQQVLVGPHLPQGCYSYLALGHSVGFPDLVGPLVALVVAFLHGWVFLQVVGPDLEAIVVAALEPTDCGVVVGLPHHVLVGPDFFGFPLVEDLCFGGEGVGEVSQLKGVVVVAPVFMHAAQAALREDVDEALVALLCLELEGDIDTGVVDQVPDQEVVLPGLEHHDLTVAEEGEGVHILFEYDLAEQLTVMGDVAEAILPESSDSQENNGVV